MPLAFLVAGCVGIADRAQHHPLSLRPAARNAARDLGPVADPAAGGAHRSSAPNNREVGNAVLDERRVRARRPHHHLEPALDHLLRARWCSSALLALLRFTRFGLRDARGDAEPADGGGDGHPHAWIDALTFGLGSGIAGMAGVALSQIDNVSPNLGQGYIIDSFMVVVFGGVGNLWGTLVGALTLGIVNKFLEPYAGAVLGKIVDPGAASSCSSRGGRAACSPLKGRAVEA